MMIIKVATDATAAIIITMFLSSSGEFGLNCLSEPLVADIVEVIIAVTFSGVVIGVVVVFAVVVIVVVVLTDVLDVLVSGANRVIGS